MKKIAICLVICLMASLLFAGCNNTPNSSSDLPQSSVNVDVSDEEIQVTKAIETYFKGKDYILKIKIPDYIEKYIALSVEETEKENLILVTFTKQDKIANIITISLFDEAYYNSLNPQELPVPSQVFTQEGITVAFAESQGSPFELGTEEGDLIDKFHKDLKIIKDSIKLTEK